MKLTLTLIGLIIAQYSICQNLDSVLLQKEIKFAEYVPFDAKIILKNSKEIKCGKNKLYINLGKDYDQIRFHQSTVKVRKRSKNEFIVKTKCGKENILVISVDVPINGVNRNIQVIRFEWSELSK